MRLFTVTILLVCSAAASLAALAPTRGKISQMTNVTTIRGTNLVEFTVQQSGSNVTRNATVDILNSNRTAWGTWTFPQTAYFTGGVNSAQSIISTDGRSVAYLDGNTTPFFYLSSNSYQCVLFFPGVPDVGGNPAYFFDTPAALTATDLLQIKNFGVTKLSIGKDGDVASGGSFRGGHKASDGTAGTTAATGGVTFKDGLYISGNITNSAGGSGSGGIPYVFGGPMSIANSSRYHPISGFTASQTSTINGHAMPHAGRYTNFWIYSAAMMAPTTNATFTLTTNGVDTAISLVITSQMMLSNYTVGTGILPAGTSMGWRNISTATLGANAWSVGLDFVCDDCGLASSSSTNFIEKNAGFGTNTTITGILATRGTNTAGAVQATNYYSADNTAGATTSALGFTVKNGLVTAATGGSAGINGSNFVTATFGSADVTNRILSGAGAAAFVTSVGYVNTDTVLASVATNAQNRRFYLGAVEGNNVIESAGSLTDILNTPPQNGVTSFLRLRSKKLAGALAEHKLNHGIASLEPVCNYTMDLTTSGGSVRGANISPDAVDGGLFPALQMNTINTLTTQPLIVFKNNNSTKLTLDGAGNLTIAGALISTTQTNFSIVTNGVNGGASVGSGATHFTNSTKRAFVTVKYSFAALADNVAQTSQIWAQDDGTGTFKLQAAAKLQRNAGSGTETVEGQLCALIDPGSRWYLTNSISAGVIVSQPTIKTF